MKECLCGIFLLLFAQLTLAQNSNINFDIESHQMLEDYNYLLLTLEETHPNLYAYISKDEFQETTNALKQSINCDTEMRDFYIILLKTISLVHQGHTMVYSDFGYNDYIRGGGLEFPFKIKYYDGHIYVEDNYSLTDTLAVGSEIISINNKLSSAIIEDFKPLLRIRPNGFINKGLSLVWSKYLWLLYGETNSYTLDYIKPYGNKIEQINIAGVNKASKKKGIKQEYKNTFRFNTSENTAILTLNTFHSNYHEFDSLLYNGFKSIASQGIDNLIIDIRNNSGGNANLIGTLMNYLTESPYFQVSGSIVKTSEAAKQCFTTNPIFINAIEQARKAEKDSKQIDALMDCYLNKPLGALTTLKHSETIPTANKEFRFKGQLYALTGSRTFSAATGFATIIKDYHLGTIIGEETSDNPTDYGSIILFDLPNSGITIQNSTEYTIRPAGVDDGHGVIPDYIVSNTYSDLITGYDRIMDYALWMIKNNYHE